MQLDTLYEAWRTNPNPQNLSNLIHAMSPTITSEIHRHRGPKTLLRSNAKLLAIKAIKTYDPKRGAALNTWVVSQLQPLARYSHKLRPVHTSEDNVKKSAEINNVADRMTQELGRVPTDAELSDELGVSVKKINTIRSQVKPVLSEYEAAPDMEEDGGANTNSPSVSNISTLPMAQEVVYGGLPDRHKFIFKHKTGYQGAPILSNIEISKRLGISPSMVTQVSNDIATNLVKVHENVI